MNQPAVSGFERDLHLSSTAAIVGLATVGVLLGVMGGNPALVGRTQPIALLLLAAALTAWLLDQWRPRAGAWALVVALMLILHLAALWWRAPLAPLAILPVMLAAGLLGLRSAAVAAAGETLILCLSAWLSLPGTDTGLTIVCLSATWAVWAIAWEQERRIRNVAQWSWEHYQQARETLEQAYSDRMRHEETLADLVHANRQLGLLNEKLAAARQVAEEAQKTKAAFVANVSHEFRTPLNMIIGLTDLLLETPEVYGQVLPPALLEDLEIVYRNCEHLSTMINDVLDLSQVEAGHLALHRERVALGDEIAKALNIVRPLIDKKGLTLEVSLPATLPEVYCDRTRIRQVILNLLSNAARLTENGGIAVRVEQGHEEVTLSVSDTGPGISPAEAQSIFQPFYRGEKKPQENQTGSGLGLTISRQFVELHDGKMWLESALGEGSTFHFKLPISPADARAVKPEARSVEDWVWYERTAPSSVPREPLHQRILICDPVGDLQAYCARYWDQVEFVACQDLEQAQQEARRYPARAVLLNAASPELLYPQLEQARLALPDLPIIGCALRGRTEHAHAAGAAGYLLKPALRANLEAALAGLGTPVRRVLIVDDSADALQLYSRMLRACDERLEVTTADTGAGALARLQAERPDLVLLDIMLPDIDGWQVLAAKQQKAELRDIPVIILSAQDPADQPMTSPLLIASLGDGLELNALVRCSQMLLELLLGHD